MKSADITKYNLEWQLIRSQAKRIKDPQAKYNFVREWVEHRKNKHTYERFINWLEGTKRGYKGTNWEPLYQTSIYWWKDHRFLFSSEDDQDIDINIVENKHLEYLYKDLSRRSLRWLAGGYVHKEQEEFLDRLASHLTNHGVYIGHDKLVAAREAAKYVTNKTSTFFF